MFNTLFPILVKVLLFFAVLASVAHLVSSKQNEIYDTGALAAFLALLSGYLGTYSYPLFQVPKPQPETPVQINQSIASVQPRTPDSLTQRDVDLFQKFENFMPPAYVKEFKNYNYLTGFPSSSLKILFVYADDWDAADCKFLDYGMETRRKNFHHDAKKLAEDISMYTTIHGSDRKIRTPNGIEESIPDWAHKEAEALLNQGEQFAFKYDDFYEYCDRKIHAPGTLDPPETET